MKQLLVRVLFSGAAFLLGGCGSSPESTGKSLAEKHCRCREMRKNMEYETTKKVYEKLLEELKDNKIQSYTEYNHLLRDLEATLSDKGDEEDVKRCEEELEKDEKTALLKFIKDEDRKTLSNALQANEEVCRDEKKEKYKDRNEKLEALKKEVNDLVYGNRLPYR